MPRSPSPSVRKRRRARDHVAAETTETIEEPNLSPSERRFIEAADDVSPRTMDRHHLDDKSPLKTVLYASPNTKSSAPENLSFEFTRNGGQTQENCQNTNSGAPSSELTTTSHVSSSIEKPAVASKVLAIISRSPCNLFILAISRWRWYDANGHGPFTRFLRADNPTTILPTLRVALMLALGFLLTASVIWLSEDEFFEGTADRAQQEKSLKFPVHVAFKDVGCLINGMSEPALHNLTGSIPPGKLTGVLGQSGSGKTLLSYQLLGKGRKFCSQGTRGQVYLNGRPRSLEAFLDRVGFVPQDDILYGDLSVEESLVFSANWRLPRALTENEKYCIVNETLTMLGLQRVKASRVGTVSERGISGGERRRVSIGMELVARPSVLIADEPTTGLDGAGAYQLVKSIRNIVDSRKGYLSVVLVLHQPSARIFDLLHHVILMSRGSIVFSGSPREATSFFSECGFVYHGDQDPQNRSAAEYILDILAGAEPHPLAQGVDAVAKMLHGMWTEKLRRDATWSKIEEEMKEFQAKETEILKTLHDEEGVRNQAMEVDTGAWSRLLNTTGLSEYCRDPEHQAEPWCVVSFGTPFPVLPKPGLRKQVHIWFWQMMRMTFRRGVGLQMFVVHGLAMTVSFVRSFNMSWSRRPHANFVLSIVICLLGMVGAVFNDDIAPVKRAADSGMILAAHELAQLAHTLILGWLMCHWFALNYFTFLWLRTGIWCCRPFRFEKYYEFTHIIHLHYLVSSGVGSCICALTNHNIRSSFILAIGALMHFHTFALFSPSKNQAERDTKILFGKVDIAPIVMFYAKWSFVRYFLEAIIIWEPDVDNDKIGRTFAMRYFSWEEQRFVADLTWLFALWTLSTSIRFAVFAIGNANAYNSAYDLPLFLVFLGKVILLHATTLIMMTFVHELYIAWKENKNVDPQAKNSLPSQEEMPNPSSTSSL